MTKDAAFAPNPSDPRRQWRHIGGDLEASFDGSVYVDVRVRGDHSNRFFVSRSALQAALGLFDPAAAPQRVAARWVSRMAGQDLETETFKVRATPDTMEKFKAWLAFFHYNGGHSGTFAMDFDGDGHEQLSVEPAPPEKYRKPVNEIAGIGAGVEKALEGGSYTALSTDLKKGWWRIDPGDTEPRKVEHDDVYGSD